MNNRSPRGDIPRSDFTCNEQASTVAVGRRQVPSWNREQLIRQFQGIDGSSRSEAERQLDAYERSFASVFGSLPIDGATQGGARK